MLYLPRPGEVHHDAAVQAPLHLCQLSGTFEDTQEHLPHLQEAGQADDQGLPLVTSSGL